MAGVRWEKREEDDRLETDWNGSIAAGENTEAAWAPDHESFAALLEAEKRAFQKEISTGEPEGALERTVGTSSGWLGLQDPDLLQVTPSGGDRTSRGALEATSMGALEGTSLGALETQLEQLATPSNVGSGLISNARDISRSLFDGPLEPKGASDAPSALGMGLEDYKQTPPHMQNRASQQYGDGSNRSRPPPRNPLSMTNKDIEFVVRMHNKQLENYRPLIDDFYLHELNRKRNISDPYLTNPDFESDVVNLIESQRRAPPPSSFHTAANSATLEKSLGTLQGWTPKAPRRLVEVAPMKSESLLFQVTDDRVGVRALIELGFDIFAAIDDIQRRLLPHPDSNNRKILETEKLFNVFGISIDSDELTSKHAEKLFVQICAMSKGKRLISKAVQVFQPAHRALMTAAVLRHLGFLCNRDLFTQGEWKESEPFWSALSHVLTSCPSLPSLLWILWSFLDGHDGDNEGIVAAISSEYGGQIICALLSRAYALTQASPGPSKAEIDDWNQVFDRLFAVALNDLGTIFQRSDMVSKTWEITAMLDALSKRQGQERLRASVAKLLRAGIAPPPKSPSSD